MLRRSLFVLLAAFAAGAVHAATGSGTVAREARTAGDFQAIELRGDIDLVVRQSGRTAVEVQADDNLLPLLETEVVDGRHGRTLRIGWRRGESVRTRSDAVVTVDVAQLRAVASSGSGDVRIDALAAPEFALSLAGSGDVSLSGRAERFTLSIAGSGDVAAQALAADEVKVSIAGSGDARVHAERALTVAIAGSGDVVYSGSAAVKSSVAGSGSVRKH